ncbi:E3 ubiquitin-protein ligase RNF144A-like [Momordica charantia]|uniref:RBR-type E3 ubiquitin transferase n=1 Tax=Momordica charantia TaxID=3673 RepID=A0A6J1DGR7_MOMCH|nr:E3 ubiquitin-protein ligase RNF144A-like [Momordica charantia]
MAAEASFGLGLVDDIYFSALLDEETVFPISDEKLAESLQLQEAIASSVSASITTPIVKSENVSSSSRRVILKGESSSSSSGSETSLCIICTDTKSAAEMFTSSACSHSFCADCISKHIAAKLEDNIAVKCPEPKCESTLEPWMCDSFVPREVLERWGDALCEAIILGIPRMYCPFVDCSAAMIDDGGEAATVTAAECPSCRRMFCAQCKVGWHGEMECDEFQKLRKEGGELREDLMALQLANRQKWKRCPHCKIYVEKVAGCLHITCSFCIGAEISFAIAVEPSGVVAMHVHLQLMNVGTIHSHSL